MGEKARKNFVKRMITGLVLGVICGIVASFAKTSMAPDTWNVINMILFQDITVSAGRSALGLFYIVQTLFTNALKLAIVPMVFFSSMMSVCSMNDMRKLGRIAGKTIITFVLFYLVACVFAAICSEIVIGMGVYRPFQVDQAAAQALLEEQLLKRLDALIGEDGEVESTQFAARVNGDRLEVTLTAQCLEEIGQERPGAGAENP